MLENSLHYKRRSYYRSKIVSHLKPGFDLNKSVTLLCQMIRSNKVNELVLAHFLAELLKLAAEKDPQARQFVASLPEIISRAPKSSRKLSSALKRLLKDPAYASAVRYVLNKPPDGAEKSFRDKRRNLGVRRLVWPEIDWQAIISG